MCELIPDIDPKKKPDIPERPLSDYDDYDEESLNNYHDLCSFIY